MDVWHFTEMPYPHLPPVDTLSTMRVTLPSRHYDPKIGADLYTVSYTHLTLPTTSRV